MVLFISITITKKINYSFTTELVSIRKLLFCKNRKLNKRTETAIEVSLDFHKYYPDIRLHHANFVKEDRFD